MRLSLHAPSFISGNRISELDPGSIAEAGLLRIPICAVRRAGAAAGLQVVFDIRPTVT